MRDHINKLESMARAISAGVVSLNSRQFENTTKYLQKSLLFAIHKLERGDVELYDIAYFIDIVKICVDDLESAEACRRDKAGVKYIVDRANEAVEILKDILIFVEEKMNKEVQQATGVSSYNVYEGAK